MKMMYLFAYYVVMPDTEIFNRDVEAEKIMEKYDAKAIGRGTFLPTMERDIQWMLDRDSAIDAERELMEAGFKTKLKDV